MAYYVRAIEEKGFTVKHFLGPDSALDFVRRSTSEVVAIVLDIMMPPGDEYKDKDTNEGLTTGVFLLPDLRRHCPKTPVVVLTNVKNPETLGRFETGPSLRIAQKMEYPPYELADLVAQMVHGQTTPGEKM
jgi:CheY-like chemotaxis protein